MQASQRAGLAPARALAGLLVPVGLATASGVLGWAAAAPIDAVRAPGPAPVDALLALCAALACAGLLALAAVGALVTLALAVSGRLAGRWSAVAEALTPRVVRAAVGLLVGATVIGGQGCVVSRSAAPIAVTLAASTATPAPGQQPGHGPQLPPGWSPDRPAAAVLGHGEHRDQPARHVKTITAEPEAGGPSLGATIVVRRGDTLWDLAADHLGPSAKDAQVAREWPRWHVWNRSTIGPDPDLIVPGQRLRVPASRHPGVNKMPVDKTPIDKTAIDREESP